MLQSTREARGAGHPAEPAASVIGDDIIAALATARLPSGALVPDSPDLRRIYRRIDAEALRLGAKMAATYDLDDLRTRSGSHWLQYTCRELADALLTDPRLATLSSLHAWRKSGRGGSISGTHVNWYAVLLRAAVGARR